MVVAEEVEEALDALLTGNVQHGLHAHRQEHKQELRCTPDWQCTAWTTCSQARTQTRTCTDKKDCGIITGKPVEIQTCNYVPPKTTTTQEEEKLVEPETISGEGEPAPEEKPPVTGTAVTEPSGGLGRWSWRNYGNVFPEHNWSKQVERVSCNNISIISRLVVLFLRTKEKTQERVNTARLRKNNIK